MSAVILAVAVLAVPDLFLSEPITTVREGGAYCYAIDVAADVKVTLEKAPDRATLTDTPQGLELFWDARDAVAGERYQFRLRAETPDGCRDKQQWWVRVIRSRP